VPSPSPVPATPAPQPCAATLVALRELEVRVGIGVTLETYTEQVADVAVTRAGKECPPAVDKALAAYQRGIETWKRCAASPTCTDAQLERDLRASWERAASELGQ